MNDESMIQDSQSKPDVPAPLRPDQLPSHLRNQDPAAGDANGPFLVINKSGDVLDRRHYCGWRAPEYGDGYSDSRSDYDFSPEYLAQKAADCQATLELMPEEFRQEIAERKVMLEEQRAK